MKIDTTGLSLLVQEANTLTSKPNLSKQEERRYTYLLSAIAAVKAGASLEEVSQEQHNAEERRQGLPITDFKRKGFLTRQQEVEARGWRELIANGTGIERRDMKEGSDSIIGQIGTYTGLGFFVPSEFFPQVFAAMKAHDALYDEDVVTLIKSKNGRPLNIPVAGDVEVVATIVGEGGTQTSTDFNFTGHATLGAYSFKSPRFVCSLESFEDLDSSLTTVALFRKFAADRLARGISAKLVNGSGIGEPLGLMTALTAAGAPVVISSGSTVNDGSGSATNTLGSDDFANAFAKLDAMYLASEKCFWLMNVNTLGKLMTVKDRQGRPIIDFVNGSRQILGIPIRIAPSMSNMSAASSPVVLGDFSYWTTRLVVDDNAGLQIYKEAPGLIEQGNVGMRAFMRSDGALLWKDTNSPCPFCVIQQHS